MYSTSSIGSGVSGAGANRCRREEIGKREWRTGQAGGRPEGRETGSARSAPG